MNVLPLQSPPGHTTPFTYTPILAEEPLTSFSSGWSLTRTGDLSFLLLQCGASVTASDRAWARASLRQKGVQSAQYSQYDSKESGIVTLRAVPSPSASPLPALPATASPAPRLLVQIAQEVPRPHVLPVIVRLHPEVVLQYLRRVRPEVLGVGDVGQQEGGEDARAPP